MTRTGVKDTTLPKKSSKVPDRKIREIPMKKVSRVIDVQKNNPANNNLQEFRNGSASLLQSIGLELSSKPAATATWDITSPDTG